MTRFPARILIVSSAGNLSGGLRQALYQAQGLAGAGCDVHFLVSDKCEVARIAESFPLKLLSGAPKTWRKQIEACFAPIGPTVVHGFHNKAVKLLGFWGTRWRLTKKAVCVAHRGVCHAPGNPLPYLLPGVDCYAPNSTGCAKVLARTGVSRRRLHVLDNGLPPDRVTPVRTTAEVRAELGLPDNAVVVGSVLNENPLKGMDLLLKTFAGLDTSAHLVAVGTKSPHWTELAEELNVAKRVHLPGKRDHVADYLQIFDLFVLPSMGKQDSQPNTLLEALLCGVPAVASDVGGVAETLGDAGMVVPPAAAPALAQALDCLLRDEQLRHTFAAAARERAPRFTLSARVSNVLKLYETLLKRRGLL